VTPAVFAISAVVMAPKSFFSSSVFSEATIFNRPGGGGLPFEFLAVLSAAVGMVDPLYNSFRWFSWF
jgi:hypothetical protein